jgi:acetylornithine deacetylase
VEPSIVETLERLVAFPTVSRRPNLELLDHVEAMLIPAGVRVERFAYDDGTALNIVPQFSCVEFEIRPIAGDDPETIVRALEADAAAITAPYRERFPEARIEIERLSGYPGLETPDDSPPIALLRRLLGEPGPTIKVAFGTEGALYQQGLGIPAVVCGPGHMDEGHKPDEFITLTQLAQCDRLLRALVGEMADGQSP